jgi:hypothetical protein
MTFQKKVCYLGISKWYFLYPGNTMPNTRRLICQRKLLQTPAEESRRLPMRGLPVNEAATSCPLS